MKPGWHPLVLRSEALLRRVVQTCLGVSKNAQMSNREFNQYSLIQEQENERQNSNYNLVHSYIGYSGPIRFSALAAAKLRSRAAAAGLKKQSYSKKQKKTHINSLLILHILAYKEKSHGLILKLRTI